MRSYRIDSYRIERFDIVETIILKDQLYCKEGAFTSGGMPGLKIGL